SAPSIVTSESRDSGPRATHSMRDEGPNTRDPSSAASTLSPSASTNSEDRSQTVTPNRNRRAPSERAKDRDATGCKEYTSRYGNGGIFGTPPDRNTRPAKPDASKCALICLSTTHHPLKHPPHLGHELRLLRDQARLNIERRRVIPGPEIQQVTESALWTRLVRPNLVRHPANTVPPVIRNRGRKPPSVAAMRRFRVSDHRILHAKRAPLQNLIGLTLNSTGNLTQIRGKRRNLTEIKQSHAVTSSTL